MKWRSLQPYALTGMLAIPVACDGTFSPSESVTGTWLAQAGHTDFWGLRLVQTGNTISGTACVGNFAQAVRDIPVTGQYPHVRFTATLAFDGKYEKDRDQIAGEYGTPALHNPLRFNRTDGPACFLTTSP